MLVKGILEIPKMFFKSHELRIMLFATSEIVSRFYVIRAFFRGLIMCGAVQAAARRAVLRHVCTVHTTRDSVCG